MLRSRLLPVLAVAAIGLAACGAEDTTEPGDTMETVTDAPPVEDATTTVEATQAPDGGPAGGEAGDDPAAADPTEADTGPTDAGTPVPTPDEDTPVVLAFDGRPVPVMEACAGVDGAVLATTEGEVTISVIRETGVAMRYQAEDTTAETDEVEVDESTDVTVYTSTLSSDQVEPLTVTMTVAADADLPDCQ